MHREESERGKENAVGLDTINRLFWEIQGDDAGSLPKDRQPPIMTEGMELVVRMTENGDFLIFYLYKVVDNPLRICYNFNNAITPRMDRGPRKNRYFLMEVQNEAENEQILQYPAGSVYGSQHDTRDDPRRHPQYAVHGSQQQLEG